MSKKNLAVLISVIALLIAAVTAIVVFRQQIADFLTAIRDKAQKAEFTPEELEAFADI